MDEAKEGQNRRNDYFLIGYYGEDSFFIGIIWLTLTRDA